MVEDGAMHGLEPRSLRTGRLKVIAKWQLVLSITPDEL